MDPPTEEHRSEKEEHMTTWTRQISICLLLCVLSSCTASQPSSKAPIVFRGRITVGFERSEFRPEGKDEVYWVSGAIRDLQFPSGDVHEDRSIEASVEGVLSEPGSYGHLGSYQRELQVTKVLRSGDRPSEQR